PGESGESNDREYRSSSNDTAQEIHQPFTLPSPTDSRKPNPFFVRILPSFVAPRTAPVTAPASCRSPLSLLLLVSFSSPFSHSPFSHSPFSPSPFSHSPFSLSLSDSRTSSPSLDGGSRSRSRRKGMKDSFVPLILAAGAFLVVLLWRVRPLGPWSAKRRASQQALREAQGRIEAAPDDEQ